MITVGIITASDKGSRGERSDASSEVIREMIRTLPGEVRDYAIVPDEQDAIIAKLLDMADRQQLNLVLTTGGTGLGPRDVTPEATMAVITRPVPGIAEAMRSASLTKTSRAMLTRAVTGVRGHTLIINLPGSPKGVRECLEVVLPVLPHAVELLTGQGGECGTL